MTSETDLRSLTIQALSVLTRSRTYLNLLYLALTLPLAIVYFAILFVCGAAGAILSIVARNPGRTFTREYLIEHVWGDDYDGLDRAVDTQMVRLRRKLGDFGQQIEAVWGVGYRFRPQTWRWLD